MVWSHGRLKSSSKTNSAASQFLCLSFRDSKQTLLCLTFFVNGHHSHPGKQAHFYLEPKIASLCSSKQHSQTSMSLYGALFSLKIVLNLNFHMRVCEFGWDLKNDIFISINLYLKFIIFFHYECRQQSTVELCPSNGC